MSSPPRPAPEPNWKSAHASNGDGPASQPPASEDRGAPVKRKITESRQGTHIRIENATRPQLSSNRRTLSEIVRAVRSREEQETLLGEDEIADPDGCLREDGAIFGPREVFTRDPHRDLPVYYNIHRIRRLVLASIEDPYTMEQLKEPRLNVLVVKPLMERLYDEDDISLVYCLLVNRMQFLRDQHFQHHHQTVNLTRANLCELVAMKMLRRFDEENHGRSGLLLLANILVAPFQPFQNAPPEITPHTHTSQWLMQGDYEGKLTALEVAIISESKVFLSSSACQKIIDAVYRGRIVYTPTAFLDIIPDHYKHKPISIYDPRKAPILNHYRLNVPRTRNILEVLQFIILLGLYCLCMMTRSDSTFTVYEACFLLYGLGWSMDECISILEHGWEVHTQNLWAFLDLTFVFIYVLYLATRTHGYLTSSPSTGRQALDILAIAALILFPRLAFNLMPENMLFVALRAMMKEFTILSLIAVWCFGGFLVSLKWLSLSTDVQDPPGAITTSKWMLWIWFGLDGTGIEEAPRFHRYLGPTVMVIYAFLGNTLFLTVLVAILTNTFSKIAADATAEIQFRRAVLTFENVKSDALFAYRPPVNVLALLFLLPLKFAVDPRWFHKINVALVRAHNAPLLLLISWYERRYLWRPRRRSQRTLGPSKRSKWTWSGLSVHADLAAVFDEEPPAEIVEQIEEEDHEIEGAVLEHSFIGGAVASAGLSRSGSPGSVAALRRRRLSSVWQG